MEDQFTCDRCRLWQPIWSVRGKKSVQERRSARGMCRRYAPQPSAFTQQWPHTDRNDWCGEFLPRTNERRQTRKSETAGVVQKAS